jgi:hypothetical protein
MAGNTVNLPHSLMNIKDEKIIIMIFTTAEIPGSLK